MSQTQRSFRVRKTDTFAEKLSTMALSGVQLVQVVTTEETRLLRDIRMAAWLCRGRTTPPWNVTEYSITTGFTGDVIPTNSYQGGGKVLPALQATGLPEFKVAASDRSHIVAGAVGVVEEVCHDAIIINGMRMVIPFSHLPVVEPGQSTLSDTVVARPRTDTTFIVFKDLSRFFDDMVIRRTVRDLFENNRLNNSEHRRVLVFVSPTRIVHPEVAYAFNELIYALPDKKQLLDVVDEIGVGAGEPEVPEDLREKLAHAMAGFTHVEACDALAEVVTTFTTLHAPSPDLQDAFNAELLREVYHLQAASWRREKALELVDMNTIERAEDVGGYDLLMEWIREISICYRASASRLALDIPKGMVLGGLPGTGKSVAAKMIAGVLQLPLVILKMSDVFGSLVGDSEAAMEHALRRIQAKGRCVVVIDEMDKALGGMVGGEQQDSGVSSRVFGKLLTWQADRSNVAFLVGTLNRADKLPPELLRAGRFDRVYFVDLPNAAEREEILTIHLRKRGLDLAQLFNPTEIAGLLAETEGFVGAELEQGVKDALRRGAFLSNGESIRPSLPIMLQALRDIIPVSRSSKKSTTEIQVYFDGKARPVSSGKAKARELETVARPSVRRVGKSDPNCN